MPVLYGGGYYAGGSAGGSGGIAGPSGAQGASGIQGPQGISGVTGIQGPAGSQGTTGLQGPTGLQGGTGLQGPTGLAGVTGIQGPTGLQGGTGLQGPTGLQGVTGIQGPTGFQGPTGLQGPSGARGATGIAGAGGSGTSTLVTMTDVVATGLSNFGQSLYYDSGTTKYQFRYGNFPIWDIRDFGAVGDNSTDNYNAFINVGKASKASGGTIYIPASTGAYVIYSRGDPGTGGLTGPWNGWYYGLIHVDRPNITIYSEPGAEVKTIVNIPNSGVSGNWFCFLMLGEINNSRTTSNLNIINGKYSIEYTDTTMYTNIQDAFNRFDFINGPGSTRCNFLNVNFSGWCIGAPLGGGTAGMHRRLQINDTFYYNCNFVNWGPGEPDDLMTTHGRNIYESCNFEFTPDYGTEAKAKRGSHAIYIGSDRPYVRVKNNTFTRLGPAAVKFMVNFYSTSVNVDWARDHIVSNNTFINHPSPIECVDSCEYVTVKNNQFYGASTGLATNTYSIDFYQGRGFTAIDNFIDEIYFGAETQDVLCYRNMYTPNQTTPAIPDKYTACFPTLISNNVYSLLAYDSADPGGFGLNTNNILIGYGTLGSTWDSYYYYLVNGIHHRLNAAVGTSFVGNGVNCTGTVLHNVLAIWGNDANGSTTNPRMFVNTATPWFYLNGVQLLSFNTTGTPSSALFFNGLFPRSLKKNMVTFMNDTLFDTQGNNSASGYAHMTIGFVAGGGFSTGLLTGVTAYYNIPSGAVYR